MRISDLPGGTLGDQDVAAVDNGTGTTRKIGLQSEIDARIAPTTSGTFTKAGTVTLNANTSLDKAGRLVVFNIDASTSVQIASGTSGQGFVTFPSGFCPPAARTFIGRNTSGTLCEYYLGSDGKLQTMTNIPANATFRLSGSFFV